jgi:2-oxoisovalerate dehydrogenase E1 component
LEEAEKRDPLPKFKKQLNNFGFSDSTLEDVWKKAGENILRDYDRAANAEDPSPSSLMDHAYAPTPITEEKGERAPQGKEATVMVDCALFAMQEILSKHPEALLYGQDVGKRLGGVFR